MNNIDEFKNAKYGLMIHFGLYSLLGGIYKGQKGPNLCRMDWMREKNTLFRDE